MKLYDEICSSSNCCYYNIFAMGSCESAKVGRTCKAGQGVNLRGKKYEQPVSCVVLNSIRKINFHWVFLFT